MKTFKLSGLTAAPVTVELRASPPATQREKDGAVRVRSALTSMGRPGDWWGSAHIAGAEALEPWHDLPTALSLLAERGEVTRAALDGLLAFGELSLNGDVRSGRGARIAAKMAAGLGYKVLCGPYDAADISGICAPLVATDLATAIKKVNEWHASRRANSAASVLDFADVVGQERAKRALEIGAAGRHNVFLLGPPGTGKTMLANRVPGILPDPSHGEREQILDAFSASRLRNSRGRPLRAPHHTASAAGLLGYKNDIGEVTLANHGVLFLDEFPEFHRGTVEAVMRTVRAGEQFVDHGGGVFERRPTAPLVIAASNLCPCGRSGIPPGTWTCNCSPDTIGRWRKRLAEMASPWFDVQAMVPAVSPAVSPAELAQSEAIKARVAAAWERQARRYGAGVSNASAPAEALPAGQAALAHIHRVAADGEDLPLLRVAVSIADLAGTEATAEHVEEAAGFRCLVRS